MHRRPRARFTFKNYPHIFLPIILFIVLIAGFSLFPVFLMQILVPLLIVYFITGTVIIFGQFYWKKYKKKKNQNSENYRKCPYCKQTNPPYITNCEFCDFPLDEEF